ncbi:MAG TPA: DUF1697 domain-containing protein, partial [Saprospiraceae bacterium]|nr:DUF1697 domain-containing protein [Saprospiraceae bacterium]
LLAETIQEVILKNFGFDIPVIVFGQAFLTQVIHQNPFLKSNPDIDSKTLYVAFLSEKPSPERIQVLQEKYKGDDEFVLLDKIIYLRYKNGAGRTKLTNNYIETHLKVKATSRNWKTTIKLSNM